MAQKRVKLVLIFLVIILLAVLMPSNRANAAWMTDWLGGSLFDMSLGAILTALSGFLINLVGEAITWAAGLLDSWIQYMPVSGVFFVDESWKIIRNFVNMFFILVLIVMAFGTIFDIKKYTWKDMLVPFLIAALLINFSLAIGQYIISIANGLSGVFLKEIGTVSNAFGDGLQLANILKAEGPGALDSAGNLVITAVFGIILLIIVFLALFSTAVFVLARTVALWFLLIISPIAWLGYALPNLKQKMWGDWWKNFWCWCFFLPYYLFFLMFAIIFIGNKDKVPLPSAVASGSVLNQSLTVNTMFMYGISLVFLIGGLAMARKLACASGSRVGMVFGAIETGVRKYAPGAAYVRGGVAGLKERGEEIKEKGVLGIGGAQRGKLQEATGKGFIAGIPGLGQVPGARETASRAQAAAVDDEVKRLQTLNLTLDQLNEKLKTAKGPEKTAAFKLKAEAGWLQSSDMDEINKMMDVAGGGKTAVGASLIQSLKKGKFHDMAASVFEKERIFANLKDTEVRKAFGSDMAQNREVMKETIAKQLLDLYANDARDVRDKVEESIKKNLANFAKTKKDRAAFLQDADKDKRLRTLLAKQMHEDGEINNYAKYITAANLFGGENETQARDMFRKIAKEDPITSAEVEFRQTIGNSDPTYTPTAAEQAIFTTKLNDNMKKVNTKQLADADKDSRWLQPWFLAALQQKVNDLQLKDPAIPEVRIGQVDPLTGARATKSRKAIPGGGERFIQAMKKAVGEDLDKLGVVTSLKI